MFDFEQQFTDTKDRIIGTIKSLFPRAGKLHTLKLKKIWVDDKLTPYDFVAQKEAKVRERNWSVPVYADLELIDNASGKVIDQEDKVRLAMVPKMTSRGSFIVRGNEYQVSNMLRLKPGVYTIIQNNGVLDSWVNLAQGKNFNIMLDPKTGIFTAKIGTSNIKLYQLLLGLGVNRQDIETIWGKELTEQNSKKSDYDSEILKAHKAFMGKPAADVAEALANLTTYFSKTTISPETTKKTLGKEFSKVDATLLLEATKKVLGVSRGEMKTDDRDALEFKTLHSVEDLLPERVQKTSLPISRSIDRNLDRRDKIKYIISPDTFGSSIETFFTGADEFSGLAQVTPQTNPLSILGETNKTTTLGPGGIPTIHSITMEARAVNPTSFGFLDPVHTPEAERVGTTLHLAGASKVGNDLVIKLIDTKTMQLVDMTPSKMARAIVAFRDQYEEKRGRYIAKSSKVKAINNGVFVEVGKDKVDYIFPSAKMFFDASTNMIPFLPTDQGNRAMMASKMLEQALPLVQREIPLVQPHLAKGVTYPKILGEAFSFPALETGTVTKVTEDEIRIRDNHGRVHPVALYNKFPLNSQVYMQSEPNVKVGDKVKKGQLIADSNYTREGTLALGTNLTTAYVAYKGYNFEDGIVISQGASKKLTSMHMHQESVDIDQGTVLSLKKFKSYYPNVLDVESSKRLDDEGVVKVGQKIKYGDVVIAALKQEDVGPESEMLRKLHRAFVQPYRNVAAVWMDEDEATVVDVVKQPKKVTVYLTTEEAAKIGDKLCYDDETEVLTSRGWVYFKDLKLNDKVCSLKDDKIEYVEPSTVHRYDHNGPMYQLSSQQVSLGVTLNHKLYVKGRDQNTYELIEAEKALGKRVQHKKDGLWTTSDIEWFSLPGYWENCGQGGVTQKYISEHPLPMNDWLMFFGLWMAEGWVDSYERSSGQKDLRVSLCVVKERERSFARQVFAALNLSAYESKDKTKFFISYKHMALYLKNLSVGATNKRLPEWVWSLSARQARILIESMMQGDGSVCKSGSWVYFTSSSGLADDMQRLCLHAGWSANKQLRCKAGHFVNTYKGHKIIASVDQWAIRIVKTKNSPQVNHGHSKTQKGQKEEIINYEGSVWCCTVPSHVMYVRRQGKPVWCGNSNRHGGKGVITRIISDAEMPQTKAGKPVEIMLNPSGIIGRINLGQMLETAAGKIAEKTGKTYMMDNFSGENYTEKLRKELKDNGISDKEDLHDPGMNKDIPGVLVGKQYIMKLDHPTRKKFSARSVGGYTMDLQPHGGGGSGGQTIGKMEFAAMLAHGAKENLREMATVKCFTRRQLVSTDKGKIDIARIVNNKMKVNVLSVDKDNNVCYRPIKNYWKKRLRDKMVAVRTLSMREDGEFAFAKIKCTEGHAFYTLNGKVEAKDLSGKKILTTCLLPNPIQTSVLIGSILGDGHISKRDHHFAAFHERHCKAQRSYLELKAKVFGCFGKREIRDYIAKGGYGDGLPMAEWSTLAQPWLNALHNSFYPDGTTKVVPDNIEDLLDELAVAIWYFDDGCVVSRRGSSRSFQLSIATRGFSRQDLDRLRVVMKHKFGISFSITKEKDLICYGENARNLQMMVAKYALPCFAEKVKFAKEIGGFWENADLKPQYGLCEVPVISVDQHEPTFNDGKFLYNLEVEETHKYFVDGILVGNSEKNDEFWRFLQLGHPLPAPQVPFSFQKLEAMIKGMGVDVVKDGNKLQLAPMTDKQVMAMSNGEIKDALAVRAKDLRPEKDGIFDPAVTGGLQGKYWNHVKLAEPVPNPIFEMPIRELLGLTEAEYRDYVDGRKWVLKSGAPAEKGDKGAITGGAGIKILLSKIDVEKEAQSLKARAPALRGTDLDKINRKLRYLAALKEKDLSPTVYVIENFPIVPAVFRPVYALPNGNLGISQINELYRDTILVSNQLKESVLPDDLKINLRRDLYDGLKGIVGLGTSLSGRQRKGFIEQIAGDSPKTGYFQSKIMGRRQEMSGRSTVIPEPSLGLDEIALPELMAWKLYEPFIIKELVQMGYTPLIAKEHLVAKDELAKKALEIVMQDRPVMMNRAPTLHKFSIMALKPQITSGKAIKTNPLVIQGYNMDFDGDTASIHVPIGEEARKETFKMLPSANLFSPKDGTLMNLPSQEAVLGLYLMTTEGKDTKAKFKNLSDAIKAYTAHKYDLSDRVTVGSKKMTLGQAVINSVLPEEYRNNSLVASKRNLATLLNTLAKTKPQVFASVVSKLKDIGNEYAYKSGFSIGLEDLAVDTVSRDKIFAEADRRSSKIGIGAAYAEASGKLDDSLKASLTKSGNPFYQMVASGARGNMAQLRQILGAPVLVKDMNDQVIPVPIKKSFSEGLGIADYLATMPGSRKGIIDRALMTSKPGAFSKELVSATIQERVSIADCGTHNGLPFNVNDNNAMDRYLAKGVKGIADRNDLVTSSVLTKLRGKVKIITVRSPSTCEAPEGVCQMCYGLDEHGKKVELGRNIGVLAAQTITEPMAQMTMRTFHTGSVAESGKGKSTLGGFQRVKELLEMHETVRDKATLSDVNGKVERIKKSPAGGYEVVISGRDHFIDPGRIPTVKAGQELHMGDPISDGVIKPQELLPLKGIAATRDYLISEMKKEFDSQGIKIKDKVFETAIRPLINIAQVIEVGSSHHTPGDVTTLSSIYKFNKGKDAEDQIKFEPRLKGVNTYPLISNDWLTRLNYQQLSKTLTQGAAQGWKADIQNAPVGAYAYGAMMGKKASEETPEPEGIEGMSLEDQDIPEIIEAMKDSDA